MRIAQKRLLNGYILNRAQLIERAREVFEPTGSQLYIAPVVFSPDVDSISIDWIQQQMLDFGIKRKDLIKQLAVDKSTLSLYLSGEREMGKLVKAALLFYIPNLYLEQRL